MELSAITGLPYISIHAPPRGATIHPRHVLDPEQFQFTPLREGRPTGTVYDPDNVIISIHAPPRGATALSTHTANSPDAFQFTPLREGRLAILCTMIIKGAFQFTPLREGRRNVRRGWNRQPISIHAPPRGATQRRTRGTQVAENFNSRPSARGDRLAACRVSGSTNFNSRPSARGDSFSSSERRFKAFQFTPLREGRRERAEFAEFARPISIHAPPRGATLSVLVIVI